MANERLRSQEMPLATNTRRKPLRACLCVCLRLRAPVRVCARAAGAARPIGRERGHTKRTLAPPFNGTPLTIGWPLLE
eukprot:11202484-Lingulodinium_polyedra.AAC.1